MFPATNISSYAFMRTVSIVYRAYATLSVITIVDDCQNPLAILDIIHTFVHVLNGCSVAR
jgi:AP-3 complex subunit sigma